jgi:MFS family permease
VTSRAAQWDRSTIPFVLSSFFGSMGALALVTALGKQVFDLTHRELDLGFVGLAEFAPAALLVLVTGSIADRHDRRVIASVALGAEALTALVLLAYIDSEPTAVGPIFAIAALFGVCRAFAAPATRSLPADVVPAEQLPWLIARWSTAFQLALVIGPVIGGSTYAVDPRVPYVVSAALLAVASALLMVVRVPAGAAAPPARAPARDSDGSAAKRLHEATEGLRFVRSQPILLGAISLDLFAVLFGGAVALLPAIAEERLGVGAVGFGWLRAAVGIGAGIVTLVLTRRPVRRRVGRTLLLVVALFGVGTIVLGVTRSYTVAFIALAVLSGADAVSVFIRSTLVPLVTPSDKRGRVLAVEMVFIGASNELGAFESGVAGQALGPAPAVVLGGVATLAIAVGWWYWFPALRDVDTFPSPEGIAWSHLEEPDAEPV